MKKFWLKAFLILLPVLIFEAALTTYYTTTVKPTLHGDLGMLGKMPFENFSADFFQQIEPTTKCWGNFGETTTTGKKVLSFGDSSSQRGTYGYQNALGYIIGDTVINYPLKSPNYDPIGALFTCINNGTIDSTTVSCVILEIGERNILGTVHSCQDDLASYGKEQPKRQYSIAERIKNKINFLPRLMNWCDEVLTDLCQEDILGNKKQALDWMRLSLGIAEQPVLHQALDFDAFSRDEKMLHYYYKDFEDELLSTNQYAESASERLTEMQHYLAARGIGFVVVSGPNKSRVYAKHCLQPLDERRPDLSYLKQLPFFVDPGEAMIDSIDNGMKDVFLYHDTHWSSVGSRIIAIELAEKLKELNYIQ